MKLPHASPPMVLLAGCAALLYVAVLAMGAGCALVQTDPQQGHQHHHGEHGSSPQNVFCEWACQAMTDATVATKPPPAPTERVVWLDHLSSNPLVSFLNPSPLQARAPPSITFARA